MLLDQPSVQLYTVRRHLDDDLPGTVERLAEIGYRRVEPYALLDYADALGPALAATGLAAPTAHMKLLGGHHDAIFAAAGELGVQTVIDPKIDPARWQTRDGIARIAEDLSRLAERAAVSGLRVGYHNHAFELSTRIDGVTALEVFAELVSPDVVLEVDCYWAAAGGEDPAALLDRLGNRVRYLHLKDGPPGGDVATQVAVGDGSLPMPDILAAARWLEVGVVELDDFTGDVWEPVAESLRYLEGR